MRFTRSTLLIGAVALGTATIGTPGSAASPPQGTNSTVSSGTATVRLVTGDLVALSGNNTATFSTPGGASAFETSQDASGDRFVIPAEAVPYLGRGLDRSLFDVSALARDGITGNAPIPVRLSFTNGATPIAPAGVTLTSVSGTSAQGYLTASSGPEFTAALRQRIGADIAAGHQAGSSPLPNGLTSISLAAAGPPAPPARPHYPLRILRMNVTDIKGAPAGGVVADLINTDSWKREFDEVPVQGGLGKVAVPAGHYAAFIYFPDFDKTGKPIADRFVATKDFTVNDSSTPTTISIDERAATSKISVKTPRPAVPDGLELTFFRFDATGDAGVVGLLGDGRHGTYVNPTPAAKVGKLHYVVQWHGTAPKAGDGYRYDVAFPSDKGIPANEAFVARPSQLATVHHRLSADPAARNKVQDSLLSGAVDQTDERFGSSEAGDAVPAPGDLTQYIGTADGGNWIQLGGPPALLYRANPRQFAANQPATVDWAHGPLGAGVGQYTGPNHTCQGCIGGGVLSLAFNPLTDSAGHAEMISVPSHFMLYRDGTKIADTNTAGATVRNIPATAATYRAVLDVDTSHITGVSQSTTSHTDLAVKYVPGLTPGNTLPSGDTCTPVSTAGTPCQILPALNVSYQLASDLTNTSSATTQTMGLRVGHLSYDGAGTSPAITSATVSVSFDGGKTWHQAGLTGTAGHYLAKWQNPGTARGTKPALKITATDAAGGSITQTIANAYTIAK